mgnify:CR=1 FL=1
MAALPKLLKGKEDRRRALELCWDIAGPREEMSPESQAMMARLAAALDQEAPQAEPPPSCEVLGVDPVTVLLDAACDRYDRHGPPDSGTTTSRRGDALAGAHGALEAARAEPADASVAASPGARRALLR